MRQTSFPRFVAAARGGMLLLCAVVVVLAWVIYRQYAAGYRADANTRLTTIAEMKSREVSGWRRERLADAQFFVGNQAVIDLASRVLAPGGNAASARALRDLLERMQRNHQYTRIALYDAAGTERVFAPDGTPADPGHMGRMIREAATSGRSAYLAVHTGQGEVPHVVLVAPLEPGLGAVVISVDAGPALADVVGSWPVPATTATTHIAMRSNDTVLLLDRILDAVPSASIPNVSMTNTELAVVQAVMGASGILKASDEDGTAVVAVSEPVAGSPWHIVVSQTEAELYGPLRVRAALIGTIALLVLLTGAAGLGAVWRGHTRQVAASERALLESLKSMAEVVEASPVVLFQWKADGTWPVEWVSANVSRWGHAPEALMAGTPPYSNLIHPDDRARVNQEVRDFTASGAESFVQEYRILATNGRVIWVDDRTTVVRSADGIVERYKGILTDITERKQLQEQFVQAQKMETVGRLAGGVAHDFNNLLTVINGYAELALNDLPPADARREMIQEIHDAGQRASALTGQLLTFSRRQVVQTVSLDLNVVADQMRKMLERLIGEHIRLTFDLDPGVWRVKADAGQIEQVIMNLAVNARDAMPDGGALTVTTRNVEGDPGTVMLVVADTGCGMDEETQRRVFEPFFTTKPAGQGTGLGLATVYGIVTQSGGHIDVASAPGQGSTFSVSFPRHTGTGSQEVAAHPAALVGGSERILLVEDEASLQRIARRILESAGYRLVCADNGAEALALCARDPEPFDLLLTDVVMPGMSGHELASRLAGTRPAMKVLFASGYLHDAFPDRARLGSDVHFLAKPYTPTSLTRKVRDVLDRA
jgi:PAS domain S-box-containing protein